MKTKAVRVFVALLAAGLLQLPLGQNQAGGASSYTVRTASGDLGSLVTSFVSGIPRSGTQGYDPPSESEAGAMASAFDFIQAGRLDVAALTAGPLGYSVVRFTDSVTGRRLVLLRENRRSDGSWPHAWGLYAFSPATTSRLLVEVTHPVADARTEVVGLRAFRRANARGLFIAGAHRSSNSDGSADVAHRGDSVFEAVHRAALEPGTRILQPHGFDEHNHPSVGDAVVSSGASLGGAAATSVWRRVTGAGFDACLYDGRACSQLAGTTNSQGASARSAGAAFVHFEVARSVRDSSLDRTRISNAAADALR